MITRPESAKLRVTERGFPNSTRLLKTDAGPMSGYKQRGYQGDISEVEHNLRGYRRGELENKDVDCTIRYQTRLRPTGVVILSFTYIPQYLMSISTDTHSLDKRVGDFLKKQRVGHIMKIRQSQSQM
jgi:hypothetical protein